MQLELALPVQSAGSVAIHGIQRYQPVAAVWFHVMKRVALNRHGNGGMHRTIEENNGKATLFVRGELRLRSSRLVVFVNLRLRRIGRRLGNHDIKRRRLLDHYDVRKRRVARVIIIVAEEQWKRGRKKTMAKAGVSPSISRMRRRTTGAHPTLSESAN